MSANDEAAASGDLKGGHAPAVKVAGMRVVQHKEKHDKTEQPTMTPEEEEEFGTSPPKADKHHSTAVVSGAQTKGDKDFPPQAVKIYHDKPQPAHEKPRGTPQHNIHQPR